MVWGSGEWWGWEWAGRGLGEWGELGSGGGGAQNWKYERWNLESLDYGDAWKSKNSTNSQSNLID